MKRSYIFFLILFCISLCLKSDCLGFEDPPTINVTKPKGGLTKILDAAGGGDFTTLSDARGNVGEGNTLKIKAGTYTYRDWNESGSAGNEIVIEAYGDGMVYIEVTSGNSFNFYGNYVIIDGGTNRQITFRRRGTGSVGSLIRLRGDNQTIWRVNVTGPTGCCDLNGCSNNAGIRTNTSQVGGNIRPSNFRIYNCIIEDCGHKGMYLGSAKNGEIRNNVVRNTQGTGIQINPNSTDLAIDGLIIAGNVIYNNGNCAGLPGHNIYLQGKSSGSAPWSKIQNVDIYNNLIFGSERSGIHIASCSTCLVGDVQIYNNTIYSNGQYGLSFQSGANGNMISFFNNIIYNNAKGAVAYARVVLKVDTNNLTTNPYFISTNQTDTNFLKLSTSSTNAIDQGANLPAEGINDDFFGNFRPQGGGYDIGAHEYVSGGSDTSPPVLSNGSPSGTLPSGTTSVNLGLTTNESATCRYSTTSGVDYSSMTNAFLITGSTSHSTTIAGLQNGQTYNYYVKAQDSTGNENTNDYLISFTIASASSDTQAPSIPTNLTAQAISSSQIDLTWNVSTDNVGVTGYRIYRDGSQIATTANTTYQDTGLSPSTTYMYTVSAIDGAGNESVLSTGISATTNNGSLFEDDFQRLDSGIVGNGWIEAESGSQVKISNGRLVFDAKDDSFRPLIHHNYLSQSSGIITWTFDLNFQRTGSEGTYSFWMQLGQESLMDTAAPMDKGIAVNLKWGGPNDGFSTHEGLGYVVDGLVTQVATVSGGNERITVSVDLDSNTYNVSIGGQEVTNIPLENNVSIDTVRFFAHNLNMNNFAYREIDNVVINGGGDNPEIDTVPPVPPQGVTLQ